MATTKATINDAELLAFREALALAITPGATENTELDDFMSAPLEDIRESFKGEWGYDPEDVWKNERKPGFSLNSIRESIKSNTLRESITQQQFFALTRYGVNKQILDGYKSVPTIYKDVAQIVQSNSAEEVYFPLYGTDVPTEVEDGEAAGESRMAGFAVRIQNKRYAKILPISKTLLRNDQTGQLRHATSDFGKRMSYAEERVTLLNFFAASASAPAQSVAGTAKGQNGQATTAGLISQAGLEDAWTAATYQVDPLGELLLVDLNGLIVSKADEILTKKLLEGMYTPTVPGAAGSVGYFMTKNVVQGLFTIHATPFVDATGKRVRSGINATYSPWALLQKQSRAMVFQNRTPLTLVQEDPNSGKSFETNQMRYLTEREFGAGVVDALYAFWGN